MNYQKIMEMYSRYVDIKYRKYFVIGSSIVIVIIAGLIYSKIASNSKEVIIPKSNGQYSKKISDAGGSSATTNNSGEYDYTEAVDHIGERAVVKGTVLKVFTVKSGVTFLDFCSDFSNCPFSAVIFASDLEKFGDITKLEREVKISGLIKSYNGKAEIVLNDPKQVE